MKVKVNGEWKNNVSFVQKIKENTIIKKSYKNPEYIYPVVHKAIPLHPKVGVKYAFHNFLNIKIKDQDQLNEFTNVLVKRNLPYLFNTTHMRSDKMIGVLRVSLTGIQGVTINQNMLLEDGTLDINQLLSNLNTIYVSDTTKKDYHINHNQIIYTAYPVKDPTLFIKGFDQPINLDAQFNNKYNCIFTKTRCVRTRMNGDEPENKFFYRYTHPHNVHVRRSKWYVRVYRAVHCGNKRGKKRYRLSKNYVDLVKIGSYYSKQSNWDFPIYKQIR